jgi:hypothetical protein
MESASNLQVPKSRPDRSHFVITANVAEDLKKLELDRRKVHQTLSRGNVVNVKIGQRLPDSQIGDHTFPGLVREVVTEFEYNGRRVTTRGDTVVAAKRIQPELQH